MVTLARSVGDATSHRKSGTSRSFHTALSLDELLGRLKRVRKCAHGFVACCPAHDDRHPSLSLKLVGTLILLHCFKGCSLEAICDVLRIRVRDLFHCEEGNPLVRQWTDAQRREHARKNFWLRSRPAAGAIAETYLHNRGIEVAIPQSIRFIPRLFHREYGWDFPAMVCGIQDVGGEFAGVSVTWLCADGGDKAPVEPARKIFGPYKGGTVRLTPPSRILATGEGVETLLSVVQARPDLTVWAALSAKNLPHVQIPPDVDEVIICADPGFEGERAAQQLGATTHRRKPARQDRTHRPQSRRL